MFNIKNKFISFEGIDGSGKTTQSKMLVDYLNNNNIKTIWTREIGGTDAGEKIRDLVINNNLDNMSELLLIMAARNEHIQKFIKPNINENITVICDRYIDSSAAYQSKKNLTMDMIYDLHKKYLENYMPSLTFYIDITYKTYYTRIAKRTLNDRYDYFEESFFIQLQENYRNILKRFPDRFIRISGDKDVAEINKEILEYMLTNS
jgi:dTMP kinase